MRNKRGVELVINSMVIIILGLLVLVMGMIFTTKIMCNGIKGLDDITKFTQDQIDALYEDQRSNVLVKEKENEIQMGVYHGIGFVITNEDRSSNSNFRYVVSVRELGDCEISEQEAENYIVTGRGAFVNIVRGKDHTEIIKFKIPRDVSECSLTYEIRVENDGEFYGSSSFDVSIKKTILSSICRI